MATELLEIQPRVLKFTFEVKQQSSCSIQLGNGSNQYIAFKIKTTSPKKYCVRPNTGVIKPKATFDFTVTMQAQRIAPPDMQCKDKFLIQSTVVPFGTTEDDITSDIFAKDNGKYIEEKKLRVILISPPPSPVLLPINGVLKQETSSETPPVLLPINGVLKQETCSETSPVHLPINGALKQETTSETSPVLLPINGVLKQETSSETLIQKDGLLSGIENIPPLQKVAEDVEGIERAEDMDELRAVEGVDLRSADKVEELKPTKDMLELNVATDFEELESKLNMMDSKLREAELAITKLTEERSMTTVEKGRLEHELEVLRRKHNVRQVQVGFPLLYVCMVALISVAVGYLIHS